MEKSRVAPRRWQRRRMVNSPMNQTTSDTQKPSKARLGILAAIFVNVVINYMDRSNISVAAPFISDDLNLDTVQMGYLFSAFSLTYASLQIPGGYLADRYPLRILYTVCLILWSVATVLQGLAMGLWVLLGLRILIGIFEAPSYPMNNRIVTKWFPDHERASAIATYTSGQFIGLAFLTPALLAIEHYAGWRALFFSTGGVGILWGIIWYFIYRDPSRSWRVNAAELDLIEQGGGLVERHEESEDEKNHFEWRQVWFILSQRKLWGLYLGQFGLGATLIFFLTWFPKYLIDYRDMNFLESGFMASVPFIFAFLGVLFSGFMSDYLVRKKVKVEVARKVPVVSGLLLSTTMIGANFVEDPVWVTFFLSLAFFGNGLASITWVFVSLIAPKNLIGLTGGAFNFIGGLAGMVVPTAIGYLVQDGDFAPALVFVSCLTLIGAASYIFLVGKVTRLEYE